MWKRFGPPGNFLLANICRAEVKVPDGGFCLFLFALCQVLLSLLWAAKNKHHGSSSVLEQCTHRKSVGRCELAFLSPSRGLGDGPSRLTIVCASRKYTLRGLVFFLLHGIHPSTRSTRGLRRRCHTRTSGSSARSGFFRRGCHRCPHVRPRHGRHYHPGSCCGFGSR